MGMRIDRAVARALANYFSANSKKSYSVQDFSPFDAEQDKEGSIGDVFNLLTGLAKETDG
jgi:hypothetical protein